LAAQGAALAGQLVIQFRHGRREIFAVQRIHGQAGAFHCGQCVAQSVDATQGAIEQLLCHIMKLQAGDGATQIDGDALAQRFDAIGAFPGYQVGCGKFLDD